MPVSSNRIPPEENLFIQVLITEICRRQVASKAAAISAGTKPIFMNPEVDWYFDKAGKWQQETEQLRKIVLDCGLEEVLKWGCPCYRSGKRNIVLIHTFKGYCALLFFKGVLLGDPEGLLVQQTGNVQAARQVRFRNAQEVARLSAVLKTYIYEAIAAEEAGLKVPMKKTEEFEMPEEFRMQLETQPGLEAAFGALTPGRQRAYLLYFSSAKQAATRAARVEKSMPLIMAGKGLND